MSHSNIHFSPDGTSISERTVGELVAERPSRSRIFQNLGIDFCCKGGQTLKTACLNKGIPEADMIARLEQELAGNPARQENPATLPAHELCSYIVETHHGYLRRELPRILAMSTRVAQVHGDHTPSLLHVAEVFDGLKQELESHIMKEETILFPVISAISKGESQSMPIDGPVSCMLKEHDDAGAALARLRELTGGYQCPKDACNTYRALFSGLQELEEDLHRHIHLENSVLFPMALTMAK